MCTATSKHHVSILATAYRKYCIESLGVQRKRARCWSTGLPRHPHSLVHLAIFTSFSAQHTHCGRKRRISRIGVAGFCSRHSRKIDPYRIRVISLSFTPPMHCEDSRSHMTHYGNIARVSVCVCARKFFISHTFFLCLSFGLRMVRAPSVHTMRHDSGTQKRQTAKLNGIYIEL